MAVTKEKFLTVFVAALPAVAFCSRISPRSRLRLDPVTLQGLVHLRLRLGRYYQCIR